MKRASRTKRSCPASPSGKRQGRLFKSAPSRAKDAADEKSSGSSARTAAARQSGAGEHTITLTYFGDRREWPGRRISIACKHPPWGRVQGHLPIFKPPWEWVVATDPKKRTMTDEEFVVLFDELLRGERWPEIQAWAEGFSQYPEDLVLLCWEKDPRSCHREQVFQLLNELQLRCAIQLV